MDELRGILVKSADEQLLKVNARAKKVFNIYPGTNQRTANREANGDDPCGLFQPQFMLQALIALHLIFVVIYRK